MRRMKKMCGRAILSLFALTAGTSVQAASSPNVPDSVYLFAYNPDNANGRSGLQLAWSGNRVSWTSVANGHQFVKSDFGAWGSGKRMFHPCLLPSPDGLWRCVWQVGDRNNQFAVTYTPDFVSWQPQDYPVMDGVEQCLEPLLSYDDRQQLYQVVFKTSEGKYYRTVSSDFYNFSKPEPVAKNAYCSQAQEVTVNGQIYKGQVFKISFAQLDHLVKTAEATIYKGGRDGELARDNEARFAGLKPLEAQFVIDASDKKSISDKLIGIFFEDINYAADGGLYAELVQNRDFEYDPSDRRGDKNWNATYAWTLKGEGGVLTIGTDEPIHSNNPHYAVLQTDGTGNAALQNSGYDGIVMRKGEKYDLSLFARQISGKGGKLRVRVLDGNRTVAQAVLSAPVVGKWKKATAVLKATSNADRAVLSVEPLGSGQVALDMVSLFPQNTFKGRKNGLRRDLAQALADLKPRFMRFPGGCVAHGDGLHNIYNWKETIGPLEARKPQRNLWGYHQSKGLGYYEYFLFCEDLGCEPLPVLAAGVCCQNSADRGHGQQGGLSMEDMKAYVQDVLDLIEWANGDAKTTVWGRKRAEQGHPKPFNLKYIGIGNEDLISKTFEERYLMLIRAVKEKYPDIVVCGTVGPWCEGSDYERGWQLADEHHIDMVDEHYYQSPGWFIYHQDYYDHYDRGASKVYLGEYAAHAPGRPSNIETALCEAMHICGMERNGDVVEMSSYAPLLAKDNHTQWTPDMIYFSNTEVRPTVGYYVQQMCGNHSGDEYISSTFTLNEQRHGLRERLAVSTVRDSKTGRVYIKLVNVLNHPVKGNFTLKGLDQSLTAGAKEAVLTVLTGKYDDTKARPAETKLTVGESFTYELPAYSFSLIAL